jgi:hypothetical protein
MNAKQDEARAEAHVQRVIDFARNVSKAEGTWGLVVASLSLVEITVGVLNAQELALFLQSLGTAIERGSQSGGHRVTSKFVDMSSSAPEGSLH